MRGFPSPVEETRSHGPGAEGRRAPAPSEARSGLLVVDKPTGVTSHDVVERVRRRLGIRAVGHLGTLDPAASGLLVVAIGAATRCAAVWQGGEKLYEGTLRFGVVTSTQDLTGEILERHPVDQLEERRVREATRFFVGEIEQIPPMVSAIKVGGQRLYRLARRGVEVSREPRQVTVSAWEWLDFTLPTASFRLRCSGGTYVRTLAHHLGARLGTGAALETLRRLRSEPFGLERSLQWSDLDRLHPEGVWDRGGVPIAEALSVLPAVRLDGPAAEDIGHGRSVAVAPGAVARSGGDLPLARGPRSVVLEGPDGGPLGLGELVQAPAGAGGLLACPHVVFPWARSEGVR